VISACSRSLLHVPAGLENRSRGTMRIEVLGEMRTIAVQEYDSFGESAFRLILRRPERKRGRRS
jgi:hypothetical protein